MGISQFVLSLANMNHLENINHLANINLLAFHRLLPRWIGGLLPLPAAMPAGPVLLDTPPVY